MVVDQCEECEWAFDGCFKKSWNERGMGGFDGWQCEERGIGGFGGY